MVLMHTEEERKDKECVSCTYTIGLFEKPHEGHNKQENPLKCNLCSESFVRVEPFEKHKQVHEDKPHHSKFCKYSSIRKSSVDIHAKINFDERPFECNHCPKRFRSKRCIVLHTRVHTGEKPFPQAHSH